MKKYFGFIGALFGGAGLGFVAFFFNWKIGLASLVGVIVIGNVLGVAILKWREAKLRMADAKTPPRIV